MAQWRASIDIPATASGSRAARHIAGDLAVAWGLAQLAQDAALVTSELVTNAARHATGSDSVELDLAAQGGGLRIALADGSSVVPIVRELDAERPAGRGMLIVEALASRWGAEDHHGGKRVWVELLPRPT